jgi:co-chaperonin GroES (HSP10)
VNRVLEDTRPLRLTLEPLDDFVVVEPTDEEAETRAGLILPASAEAQCRSGIVTAVGSAADGVAPGDKVLFPSGGGYDVRLAGTAQKVLRRAELIARIHD